MEDVHRLSFYTTHSQFYLIDPAVEANTGSDKFWTDEAHKRGLAVEAGVLGVGTASYGHVRCFFQFSRSEPTLPVAPWQRVVEASIYLSEGRYAVINCPDSTVHHQGVSDPGDYRLRVHGAFLDQVVEDGLGDDCFDFYWLVLWPAPFAAPRIGCQSAGSFPAAARRILSSILPK